MRIEITKCKGCRLLGIFPLEWRHSSRASRAGKSKQCVVARSRAD